MSTYITMLFFTSNSFFLSFTLFSLVVTTSLVNLYKQEKKLKLKSLLKLSALKPKINLVHLPLFGAFSILVAFNQKN